VNEGIERWRPVPRYEGWYEVSDLGRVRSLPHWTKTGMRGGKILKPKIYHGYEVVDLSRDNQVERFFVHVLVLTAFVGEPEPGQECRHGPNGKRDNRLTELCWGTRIENAADRLRDGTANKGVKHGLAKLTDDQIREIRARAAAGEYHRLIALDYDISRENVGWIVRGQTWGHVDGEIRIVPDRLGENNGNARFTADDVREIRRLAAAGIPQSYLATRYETSRSQINRIVRRLTWASVD
jgi:hypothetical protein